MILFVLSCALLAVLLGGLAWYKTRSARLERIAAVAAAGRRRDFRAIEIKPGQDCCEAVMEHGGRRILIERSPRLPLEGCDRLAECGCTYINHDDRRSSENRRNPYGSLSKGSFGLSKANKRSGFDRRGSSESELTKLDFTN